MGKSEIFEKVREVVNEKLNIELEEIEFTSDLIDDLGADSLDLVDLVMAFEDEFGIKVEDEDIENIRTIGDIVNYISKKMGNEDSDDDL
ncbi:MAG: acyl carrier protein [Kosmotogales bacterium]|jgi:acyl carrier protein|nr:acyl carrier protein [Kosmotogales bacterium]